MRCVFALAGNQNSGKTTLFNRITGSNQHVGNFPGVTVEKKEGHIRGLEHARLVDLPGIYSLSPYTSEEIVTRDFLLREKPQGILNIVDATNIERNLYLTLQLMELGVPMVIALNMMDEVHASGNSIDVSCLSAQLGVPVIPISASKNEGMDDLLSELDNMSKGKVSIPRQDFCKGAVHRAIHAAAHIIEDKPLQKDLPLRYLATKMIEGDQPTQDLLGLSANELHIIDQIIVEMESDLGTDRDAALADMRYQYIEQLCTDCVTRHQETNEQLRSEKIDRLLTHKHLGIPIFFFIMFVVFSLTFGVIGPPLQDATEALIELFSAQLDPIIEPLSPWIVSLVQDGILAGIGSVLSFLPLIVLLFFFLSLLEDSGYMARVAFIMDKTLRKMGLSGRSFVPMLLGFGCSVPAILSTRTLASNRDRKAIIILIPFMSCTAKLPIYSMITVAFFPAKPFDLSAVTSIGGFFSTLLGTLQGALIMISLYILGMIVALLSGLLFKSTLYRGNPTPFIMELPAYRIPAPRSVALHLWGKAKDFLRRAFTIIFLASVIIWFLQSFDPMLRWVTEQSDSILASVGSLVSPLFRPLGFTDWRLSTSLFTGIIAKEMVVSTLSVLTGASNTQELSLALNGMLSPLSAYSFLVFTLLYMPCVAAFAATKRELGSFHSALLVALYQTGVAYVVSLFVFQIGSLFVLLFR